MGYDIPQEIKYQEIIAFGLTFKQLIIAVITAPIIAYVLLPDMYSPWRIIVSSILLCVAVGLMFLDAQKHLINFVRFFLFRNVESKDSVMKKYLGIKKLGKNRLELTDETVLSFLEIEPTDIKLMDDLQKEGLAFQFQKFLNSLDFPIQIITTTTTEKFFRKRFFVITPKKQDLEIQTSLVMTKLKECGLKVKLLNHHEIVRVFNNFLKNSTKNVNVSDMNEFSHHIIAPEKIVNQQDELIQDNTHSRVISIVGYPRNVNFGFLNKIIQMQEKVDISIHIEPFSIEKLTVKLNSELQKQTSDLHSIMSKGSTNPILEIKHSDTRKVMEDLQKGEEKLFLVSLYLHCKTEDFKSLNQLTERVKNEINSLLMIPEVPKFTQAQALKSCLPLCQNILKEQRNITTKPLSAFFPFTTKFYTQDETGVEFGKNNVNQPIKKDIFKLANHNGVILASSGGGKSYLTKLLVQRYSKLRNNKVFVIDPEGEYAHIVKKLKGQVITIGINSTSNINIFDRFGQLLKLKKIKIHEMFNLLFPNLGEIQKSYLDKAIQHAYEKSGEETPFIGQIYYYLTDLESKAEDVIDKKVLSGLNNRLNMFVNGAFDFMNQQTNIELKGDLVCFYLKDVPSMVQPALIYLVMDFLYIRMKHESCNKIVFVDEAWSLLSRTKEDTYLFKLIKTCRKYKMGIFLITQEADDLLSDKTGRALLANSSTTILLRQRSTVIKKLSEIFGLNQEEQLQLVNANVGSGIAIFDKERHLLRIESKDYEHFLIEQKTIQKPEEENPYPNLDLTKGYFKKEELENNELTYLIGLGWIMDKRIPLGKKGPIDFVIKTRKLEGPAHSLMVYQLIEELKKYTDKIETSSEKNPDINFEYNGESYAIEVETGSNIEKLRGDPIAEKVEELTPKFGNNILFLVANHDLLHHYRKYGAAFTRNSILNFFSDLFRTDSSSPYNWESSSAKTRPKVPKIEENQENQGRKIKLNKNNEEV